MTINSKQKGKRGELELVHWLKERGHEARRGQQYAGGTDSPDVICETLPGVHIEVKRTEKLNLYAALSQSQFDSLGQCIPTVWHRKNNRDWVVILSAEKFLEIYTAANG